jgi:antirestriction protein ArdC
MAPKFDVYQHVTDTIVAEIEAGTPPWRKPWTGSTGGVAFPTRHNGEEYRGINVLMLWIIATQRGYVSSRWMTYKQASDLGGQVRKGEKSATVVKYGTFERENAEGEPEAIPYAKAYRVFNADQIDGLPEDYYTRPEPPRDLGTETDPELQAFFERTGAEIITSDEPRAYYDLRRDVIHMPPIATFFDAGKYFATLAHECCHWTGPEKRLGRFGKFNDRKAVAAEELVAEIGACMVCARIGIAPEFDQSAAYVEGWLDAMKEDKRAIFKAASAAQKAADYILEQAEKKEVAA